MLNKMVFINGFYYAITYEKVNKETLLSFIKL